MHLRPNRKSYFILPFYLLAEISPVIAYGLSSFPHLQQQGILTFLVCKCMFVSLGITPTNTGLRRERYVCSISCCVVYAACVTEPCLGMPSVLRTVCHAAAYPVKTTANHSCALLQLRQPVRASSSAWQIDL